MPALRILVVLFAPITLTYALVRYGSQAAFLHLLDIVAIAKGEW